MTRARDDKDVQTTERLLAGLPVEDGAAPSGLVALVDELRSAGHRPAPAPSAELARLLRDGRLPEVVPLERRRAARPMKRRAVVVGVFGVKIALVSTAAAAAMTGVATLEPVPAAIREPARELVDAVVGVLPWSPDPPTDRAPAPGRTSEREPGESGGSQAPVAPGGDDAEHSGEAPGRPADVPGGSGGAVDDAPGRSEDAPGAPGSPGTPGGSRGTDGSPSPQVPAEPPADPPAGGEGEGTGRGGGTAEGADTTVEVVIAGGSERAGRESRVADPYPEP